MSGDDKDPVPLVAVGTSLGGLEALSRLLRGLPEDFPAALAVVQHRMPDSDSRLPALLARHSRLPVREVEDLEEIRPSRVYIAPADYHLLIDGDHFALDVGAPESWARPAIDVLFESAADARGSRLIAILLTAASHDGARGIAWAARSGATTIVQDPDEAASDIAPRAALSRTRVDYVLPLRDMPSLLIKLLLPLPA